MTPGGGRCSWPVSSGWWPPPWGASWLATRYRRWPASMQSPVRRGGPRYERRRPGELLDVDVKKLGRVPDGGGWRLHGPSEAVRGRGNGYDYLHVAVDDHSRLAYIEALPDERVREARPS